MPKKKRNSSRWRRVMILTIAGLAMVLAAGILITGCLAAPIYQGPKTSHFDGERFNNEVKVPEKSFSDLLRWWWERDSPTWEDRSGEPRRPARLVDEPGRLVLTHINHSTMLLQLEGVNILTDPVFSRRVGPVSWLGPRRHRPPGVSFDDLPRIDAVLISHNHYDHLDLPTLQRLARRDRPRILVPLGNSALLKRHAIPGGEDLSWGQRTRVGPLEVVFLPSRHWSGRGLGDRYKTLWGAWVVRGAGGPIYFAGDTGWGPHFAQARAQFGPMRLALLPIGAYAPRWFMEAAHISPAEAVAAHLELQAQTSVAMHYGTFKLSDEGQDTPPRDLRRALRQYQVPPEQFLVLNHGEPHEVVPHSGGEEAVPADATACARREPTLRPGRGVGACVVSRR